QFVEAAPVHTDATVAPAAPHDNHTHSPAQSEVRDEQQFLSANVDANASLSTRDEQQTKQEVQHLKPYSLPERPPEPFPAAIPPASGAEGKGGTGFSGGAPRMVAVHRPPSAPATRAASSAERKKASEERSPVSHPNSHERKTTMPNRFGITLTVNGPSG